MEYKTSEDRRKRSLRDYYKNRDMKLIRVKEYYTKNKDKISLRSKVYREKNKHIISLKKKEYAENNHEKLSLYRRNRMKVDIQFKLSARLRNRIGRAFVRNSKHGSAVKDLGCSIEEFKFYLEGKFEDGMNWTNYGKWEIDHIIPLVFFDLTDREQFLRACHYTNLQPMWAYDNKAKGGRLSPPKTNKLASIGA